MKITVVLVDGNGYNLEIQRFMLDVCKELKAESLVLIMQRTLRRSAVYEDGDNIFIADACNKIDESDVDMAIVSVSKNKDCPGVELAGFLVQRGVESLLVQCFGEQSFNISPSYPFYTIEGPPDHRCKEEWYIKEVANDIRKGPFTQSGTVEAVIRRVQEADGALIEAENVLDEKRGKVDAERFRNNYLQLLVSIRQERKDAALIRSAKSKARIHVLAFF